MKITLDLPDDLLIEAKAVAARHRTTLKAMVERALRREIALNRELDPDTSALFEVGKLGILRLKSPKPNLDSDKSNHPLEEIENEELRDAIQFARGVQP